MRAHLTALILVPCSLLLLACASKPAPQPLPYRFTLASFQDARPEEARSNPKYVGQPFQPRAFVQALQTGLPGSIFGGLEARLNVRLKHYEVTRFKDSYAMSIVTEMSGTDLHNRPLLKQDVACSQVDKEGFALAEYATQAYEERNLHHLTPEGRAASMWQKLYNACVAELASQYATALETASLAPQAPTE